MSDDVSERLQLSSLNPGDTLMFDGDNGAHMFYCAAKSPTGPAGTLLGNGKSSVRIAQLLGMLPFTHEMKGGFCPLLESDVIIGGEYGRLLVLIIDSDGVGQVEQFICREFELYPASNAS